MADGFGKPESRGFHAIVRRSAARREIVRLAVKLERTSHGPESIRLFESLLAAARVLVAAEEEIQDARDALVGKGGKP